MPNIPNAPGMPAGNPTPADIARYNNWAARYGQPLWGAPVIPAPKAAPKASAKAAAKRSRSQRRPPGPGRGRWGQPMPQPSNHGEVQEGQGGGWIRGTYSRDRNIYARKADSTEKKLLSWMPWLGKFKAIKDGINYYRHNKQQFIINVPCIGYKWDADSGTFVMCTIGHIAGGEPVRTIVPIDDDRAMAPDLDQNPEEVKRTLLQRMEEFLREKPVIPTDQGEKHKLYQESDLIWAWDNATEMTLTRTW